MKNSDKLLELIDSFYSHTFVHSDDGGYYELPRLSEEERIVLMRNQSELIDKLSEYWINPYKEPPQLGSRVFAVTDLTPLGKGKFVNDYYFTEHGFVERPEYSDGYGYITLYISFDKIDSAADLVL